MDVPAAEPAATPSPAVAGGGAPASAAAHPAWDLPQRDKLYTLGGSLLGLLLAALDQTVVATAGPAIQREFDIPPALYAWITTAYLVATTVMVPVYGKLSDEFGRKRILLLGIGIFLAGSALCGLAWGTVPLIAFRAVQGLGAAALFTSAFSVIGDLFPPHERGKYAGLISAVFGFSSVLGPVVGGIITDAFGWHWVFFVNLPVGAVAVALIAARMPNLTRPEARSRVDVAGALLLVLAVAPLLLALSFGRVRPIPGEPGLPWTSPVILGLLALALVAGGLFVRTELRAPSPIVDLRMYREATFGVGNAASFVLGMGFLAGPTFLPLFLVNVSGISATGAGLAMLPLTAGIVLGSAFGGQLAGRVGRHKPLILGAVALLTGAFAALALLLSPDVPVRVVSLVLLFAGLGMGPTLPLLTLAVQNAVPVARIGVATASVTFSRALGQVIGLGVMGSVFAATVGTALVAPHGEDGRVAAVTLDAAGKALVTRGVSLLYGIAVIVAVAGFVVATRLPDRSLRRGAA
jgi:EmrB/QacA subfamily drug resistance transporter